MIKIEKVLNCSPTVIRNGVETVVFANQLITDEEYSTLKVTSGKVLVSINEAELVWHELADTSTSVQKPAAEVHQAPAVEIVKETIPEPVTKPAIVFPAKKTGKK